MHVRRREDAPRRAQDVARRHAAREHLAHESVEHVVVLAADDGGLDLARLDGRPQRSGDVDSGIAATEHEYAGHAHERHPNRLRRRAE